MNGRVWHAVTGSFRKAMRNRAGEIATDQRAPARLREKIDPGLWLS
jgi:hypothetical protein